MSDEPAQKRWGGKDHRDHPFGDGHCGAHGGLSPHLDREVLEYCRDRGFPFVPGIATPSEAARALRAGATTLKVFPVEQLGGPSLIAALNSVYPEAAFIVSGGISQGSR